MSEKKDNDRSDRHDSRPLDDNQGPSREDTQKGDKGNNSSKK